MGNKKRKKKKISTSFWTRHKRIYICLCNRRELFIFPISVGEKEEEKRGLRVLKWSSSVRLRLF
jgi:hypothetical protein